MGPIQLRPEGASLDIFSPVRSKVRYVGTSQSWKSVSRHISQFHAASATVEEVPTSKTSTPVLPLQVVTTLLGCAHVPAVFPGLPSLLSGDPAVRNTTALLKSRSANRDALILDLVKEALVQVLEVVHNGMSY